MSDALVRIYHHLPSPVRSMAASLWSYPLRSWRYGPDTQRLIDEAREREQWSAAQWAAWQEEHLAHLLHRAATQVPYYREQWLARRRRGDRAPWEQLENWPFLEKEALRAAPAAFIADDCDPRRMQLEQSSGTTGKPVSAWRSREMVRAVYALSEARSREWYGVSRRDRWAMVGGRLVTPVSQRRPPFWVWNMPLNQLYMSSYHLAPDLIPHYLDALVDHQIVFLLGYTSSLYALAQEVLREGRRDLRMAVAITNAEPLLDHQREVIGAAFQCPVRETYGMTEFAAAGSECPAGRLHLWPEVGWLEIFEDGQPVPKGAAGELICTGLLNTDMPLIRYRTGDRGARLAPETPCACGRLLPAMAAIEGRMDDVLYTADGRRIGRLDPVFKADLPLREAQIVQEALDRIRVRYVPAPGFTEAAASSVVERLRERLGPVEVVLEPMDQIPRSANGKLRAVICALPADAKRSVVP